MNVKHAEDQDWGEYFNLVAEKGPRETLVMALDYFDRDGVEGTPERLAVDLGCGEGRDVRTLLRRCGQRWRVVAIDGNEEGLRRTRLDLSADELARLETRLARFEDASWPPCHLLNASFSIPHCREGGFQDLWQRIARSILPGGRFAGQLFGIRDGWTEDKTTLPPSGWRLGRQFHTREEVQSLLDTAGLLPEHLDEVERWGQTANGEPKYWHVFHIVARKPLA